jgi:hypothetical protein
MVSQTKNNQLKISKIYGITWVQQVKLILETRGITVNESELQEIREQNDFLKEYANFLKGKYKNYKTVQNPLLIVTAKIPD